MDLKKLTDKRKDILFAEMGALLHDLGKLSKEFVLQATENNFDFFYEHSLIFARDYLNTSQSQFYNLNDNELMQLIDDINNKINNGFFLSYKLYNQIKQYIRRTLRNITSNNQAERFITLLQSKYSKLDDLSILKHITENLIISASSVSVADLISKHHNKEKYNKLNSTANNILELLKKNDGLDSGIDKMVAENASYSKQSKDHTYISTAFGYEKEKIELDLSDTDENSLTKIRTNYANTLANILNELKDKDFSSNEHFETWIEQRNKLLQKTRNAFLNALGETRRPANDVTLWDHSYSVASLYKSALAEVVLSECEREKKDPKEIKWKLLSIRFDGDEFYHSVNKIADVLGRKSLVEKIFEKIKILLEMIIPIGNEIYRDENGSIFLVPESADEGIYEISEEIWNDSESGIKSFEIEAELDFEGNWKKKSLNEIVGNNPPDNIKQLIEDISSFISQGIFVPVIHVSEPSRGALNIGKEINRTVKHQIDIGRLKEIWRDKKEGHLKCSACGLRPVPLTNEKKEQLDEKIKKSGWKSLSEEEKNNYKAFERKVCIDCLKTATNRVEEWSKNHEWKENEPGKPFYDTSIWLDEIADENNRIGLVYLSFELKKWLSGGMLNTFLSKPLLDSEFKCKFDDKIANIINYNQLIKLIKEAFDKNDFNIGLSVSTRNGNQLKVKELFEILVSPKILDKDYIKTGKGPLDLFKDIVQNRQPDWQNEYECPACATKGDHYHKAIVFLLHLTRKHPSFARLRRIWETTREFGIEIFKKAKEKLNKRERPVITFAPNNSLQITHTYYFKDENDTKFELVITKENEAAIILNGDKFNVPESGRIELYDEDFKNVVATLENVQLSEPKEFYTLMPYQFEPTRTLFFMPLKYVWEIIETIKKEYEIQFNKVQNRLPIRVGFVAFNKKMPMYVVLETAKKMYSTEIGPKELEVSQIDEMSDDKKQRIYGDKLGNYVKEIKMNDGNEYHFSYSTGDSNKKDLFHPYFVVVKNNNDNDNDWKVYFALDEQEQNSNKKWLPIRHVKNLQKGDKVLFYPSQFDFLWLDSNIRRFDVGEKRRHWLFKKTSPKPYHLKDIDKFKRLKDLLFRQLSLTTSQIMNLYGLLISKMQEWKLDEVGELPINDSAFEQFVKNSILSIPLRLKISDTTEKSEITQEDFEFFKDSILNGLFFDLIDMWHTVLKRPFKEEANE